jgi:hypothetical protein
MLTGAIAFSVCVTHSLLVYNKRHTVKKIVLGRHAGRRTRDNLAPRSNFPDACEVEESIRLLLWRCVLGAVAIARRRLK